MRSFGGVVRGRSFRLRCRSSAFMYGSAEDFSQFRDVGINNRAAAITEIAINFIFIEASVRTRCARQCSRVIAGEHTHRTAHWRCRMHVAVLYSIASCVALVPRDSSTRSITPRAPPTRSDAIGNSPEHREWEWAKS